ncbi:hypothetical protein G4B88_028432 [Cannabis sativa]|uniref:Uncharacterized protein n=1 Tax=Cannabis sativa TaxID=3483 RepID=A0A7J6F0W1_CANSA|nr:hypothetical protein G4B88_028432 [Cannabis sativa]
MPELALRLYLQKIFDEMPMKNIICWTSMVSGYVHYNKLDRSFFSLGTLSIDKIHHYPLDTSIVLYKKFSVRFSVTEALWTILRELKKLLPFLSTPQEWDPTQQHHKDHPGTSPDPVGLTRDNEDDGALTTISGSGGNTGAVVEVGAVASSLKSTIG